MKKIKFSHIGNLVLVMGAAWAMGIAGGLRAEQGGAEVLAKLGLEAAAAKEGVLEALASGSAYNEAAYKAFKLLPGPAREAIVRSGLAWIKSYAAGAEFTAAYDKLREQKKPRPPAPRPSAGDEMKKMKNEMEKNIAEMRKNMAAMDAQTKKDMEVAIQAMRDQMAGMGKDPGQLDLMRQAAEMSTAEDKKQYEEELGKWEECYPGNPRVLIKKRINDFLAASSGVDFTAMLLPRGDKMVFANGVYEQKPAAWKLCFRAGKEATEAARAFAKAWLAELGKK